MKAKEVLKLLNITRVTLHNYVKNGIIKTDSKVNGFYNYNEDSVYSIINKNIKRKTVIYSRVSTSKQKVDLENQINVLKECLNKNNIPIDDIYADIGSGINLERKEFQRLLNDVIDRKIKVVYITYKDRLSELSFDLIKNLFKKFNCEIKVLNKNENKQLIEKEIFTEIIDLIRCFSMKMHSSRRKEKLNLIEKDLNLENDVE